MKGKLVIRPPETHTLECQKKIHLSIDCLGMTILPFVYIVLGAALV